MPCLKKCTFAFFSGHNPSEIAAAFADLRVYDIVRTKYDSLPAPNDKKKGAKGGKKTGKSSSAGGDDGGGRVSVFYYIMPPYI